MIDIEICIATGLESSGLGLGLRPVWSQIIQDIRRAVSFQLNKQMMTLSL